jgi:hypothetical protein
MANLVDTALLLLVVTGANCLFKSCESRDLYWLKGSLKVTSRVVSRPSVRSAGYGHENEKKNLCEEW